MYGLIALGIIGAYITLKKYAQASVPPSASAATIIATGPGAITLHLGDTLSVQLPVGQPLIFPGAGQISSYSGGWSLGAGSSGQPLDPGAVVKTSQFWTQSWTAVAGGAQVLSYSPLDQNGVATGVPIVITAIVS